MVRGSFLGSILVYFCIVLSLPDVVVAIPIDSERHYGTGLATHSLTNLAIGQSNRREGAIRFRAEFTGRVTSLKFYWIFKNTSGYHSGTGGQIRIALRTNNASGGDIPGDTVLGNFVFSPGLPAVNPESANSIRFAELAMRGNPGIEEGEIYYIHLDNIDPEFSTNWVSINSMFHFSGNNDQILPAVSQRHWGMLSRTNGGSWQLMGGDAPILVLYIDTNGDEISDTSQGLGYVEWWGAQTTGVLARDQKMVRQGLSPDRNVTLTGAHVSGGRYVGTSDLAAFVIDSQGAILANWTHPASDFPLATVSSECPWGGRIGDRCHVWSYVPFAQPLTLEKGQRYFLVLTSPSDTEYRFNVVREGTLYYGFPIETVFNEGYAEISANGGGGWSGIPMWGVSNRREADMEFYFDKG